jgi:GT2 family glycosyltransferase
MHGSSAPMTGTAKKMTVIVPSLNEGIDLQDTVFNMINTMALSDYEIIVINSGGSETSKIRNLKSVQVFDSDVRLCPALAKNMAAGKASGEYLVFADAHVLFDHGWDQKMLDAFMHQDSIIAPCITTMGNEKAAGCGFKWNNLDMKMKWFPDSLSGIQEIPFAGGACMAIHRKTFDSIGQFDHGNRSWGMEDAEISLRAWTLGCRVLCDPSNRVSHKFKTGVHYPIEWKDLYYNRIRFCFLHFNSRRLTKYLRYLSGVSGFSEILIEALGSDVLSERNRLFNVRVHDDDWFFAKFPMNGWTSI